MFFSLPRSFSLAFLLLCVGAFAASLWVGGCVVLGTLVAPAVFQKVPAPLNAQLMIYIFRCFHRVELACAVCMLGGEVIRARRWKVALLDAVRVGTILVAFTLALLRAFVLGPKIEVLYRAGAVQGLGEQGGQLEATHAVAETNGRLELILVLGVMVFYLMSAASSAGELPRQSKGRNTGSLSS